MRLALFISNLGCGGAERVLSLLAGTWASRGHDVTLVTLGTETPFFSLDPRVKLVQLDLERPTKGLPGALFQLYRTRRVLRGLLRRVVPDVAVAFTTRVNVKVLMAARGLKIPVVVSERNDPSVKPLNRLWTLLRNRWYPSARALVVQTESVRRWCLERGWKPVVVLPNPVETPGRPVRRSPSADSPLILNVARLVQQKGHEDLLRAVAALQGDVRVRILGDGPQRPALEALGRELGLGARLELPGFIADKAAHFSEAAVFVLSSWYEGFPNALVEAMAEGLPCVSSDCPSGPADLIEDGVSGLLVGVRDVAAMTAALARMLADPAAAAAMGSRAQQAVRSLNLDDIADRWERIWTEDVP